MIKKCQCKDITSLGILSCPIPTLINTQAEWQALAASMIRCSLVCPKLRRVHAIIHSASHRHYHGLRTPNEGINQRNLKIWADVADKICFGRT